MRYSEVGKYGHRRLKKEKNKQLVIKVVIPIIVLTVVIIALQLL